MKALPPLDLESLQRAVHGALSDWTRSGDGGAELARHLLLAREHEGDGDRLAANAGTRQVAYRLLEETLQQLEEQDEIGARVLRLRFYEGEITRQVATRLHASPDQVNRWQRAAIEGLTALLFAKEISLRDDRTGKLLAALPPVPYSRLIGLQSLQSEIVGQLQQPGEPLVIALSGIGGIGKTSLADAALRLVAPSLVFEQMVWVRTHIDPAGGEQAARSSWTQAELALYQAVCPTYEPAGSQAAIYERLVEALNSRAVLICMDNLESEEQTTYFLERIRPLAGPGKFILTTRARPTVSAPAYFRALGELAFADAVTLLRHHAQASGIKELETASDDDLMAVYNVTGGNPLALKLVAGLSAVMSMQDILSGLRKSRPGPIETMYRSIYWETWRTLSPDAQALLQGMPLVAETGALPEQLMAISGLPENRFWPAVHELFARSLLEVRGSVRERRYSIHQLTETFLHTEIIGWTTHEPRFS
ncbi:MAG: NB-ARC domain-containing protein [Candidatus Promineifilaceae bacterium]